MIDLSQGSGDKEAKRLHREEEEPIKKTKGVSVALAPILSSLVQIHKVADMIPRSVQIQAAMGGFSEGVDHDLDRWSSTPADSHLPPSGTIYSFPSFPLSTYFLPVGHDLSILEIMLPCQSSYS